MSNTKEIQQEKLFYDPIWTKEITVFLVDELLIEKELGNWKLDDPYGDCIMNICYLINARFHKNFSCAYIRHRVEQLRSRFITFQKLISIPGIIWDIKKNNMHIIDVQREAFLKENSIVKAYMYKDEPLYDSLSILFRRKYGVDSRDGEDNVIIISSDDDDYIDDGTRSIFIKQEPRDVIHLDDEEPRDVIHLDSDNDDETSTVTSVQCPHEVIQIEDDGSEDEVVSALTISN
ncbi:hypothetical protein OROMI_010992 [Orobanche minor]